MKICDMILKRINRDYVLPSIQREFVWLKNHNEMKVQKLFDSILQGYPIGTILTWEFDKPLNSKSINCEVYKFIENYDEDDPRNDPVSTKGYTKLFLVLDGQQRLSALNLGLRGEYRYTTWKMKRLSKLYLNLFSDIENSSDNNYNFKYEFNFLEENEKSDNDFWFEVGNVLNYYDRKTDFFVNAFYHEIKKRTKNKEKIDKAKEILRQLHKAICIEDTLKIISFAGDDEKALNVFVRTNDGGVKLEKADLLLSYMESKKHLFKPHHAKKEVYDFVNKLNEEKHHKPQYDFEKDDILKASLVLSGLEIQYKLKSFNENNLKTISDNWGNIKKYIEMATLLIARYGFSSKNIISKNSLIPIAYYLFKNGKKSNFVESQSKKDLEIKNEIIKWLAISLLTGAFGSASDTTLKKLRDNINKGKTFKHFNLGKKISREDVEKWIDRECYGSKYSHLILLLITKNKYWDQCHQDHIFPKSKFEKKFYKKMKLNKQQIEFYNDNVNSIANLHLLDSSVNLVKGNEDLIDWANKQNKELLKSSLIPHIDLEFNNFQEFIEKRKRKITDQICKVLSIK